MKRAGRPSRGGPRLCERAETKTQSMKPIRDTFALLAIAIASLTTIARAGPAPVLE